MSYSKILVVDDETDLQSLIMQKFRKEIKEKSVRFHFCGKRDSGPEKNK